MKNLNSYILEKYKLTKNTTALDKEWVVFLPQEIIQYPKEYLFFSDDKRRYNTYLFSDIELKDLYISHPHKYPNYYIHKLNIKKYNDILPNIGPDKKYVKTDSLAMTDTGRFVSSIIDEKYINWH